MTAGRPEPAGASRRPRVLFISADPVGERMAGLGIRYWELARALGPHAEVTLAHGGTGAQTTEGVTTLPYRPHAPAALREPIARADVIVTHPQWPLVTRWLRQARARVIFDLYDPETLETLELLAGRPPLARRQLTATTLDRLHAALRTGHHFMCASEKQRDLWLGAMLALRLIGPETYDRDPDLRGTIDLVPFGLPDRPPAEGDGGARAAISSIPDDAEIVLWNGGLWSWLDADSAIRAVAGLAERRPRVRLVFMGGAAEHPAAASSTAVAIALARELGVFGTVVNFHDRWVPYADRGAWLTGADCAVSTHREHLETRFAFRTRLLDCFWAGLPVVCTSGDALADLVASDGLGAVVAPGDVDGLAAAMAQVLDRGKPAYQPALAATAATHTWALAARPLLRWISQPDAPRPGDAAGMLRPPLAQRLREAIYLGGVREALARRAGPG